MHNAITQKIQRHLDAVSANFKRDPERSMREARTALELAKTVEPHTWRAQSWNALGIAYGAQGKYPEAIVWFKKAVHYFESVDDLRKLIPALDNLAHIQLFAEQYAEALANATRALETAQNATDHQLQPEDRNSLLWRINFHISGIYTKLGDYDTAVRFMKSCLRYEQELDSVDLALIYGQFAVLCVFLEDYDSAIDYGVRAHAIIEPLDRSYDEGVILSNLAKIHQSIFLAEGSRDSLVIAIDYIRRSLENFRRVGARDHELMAIFILASMYLDATDFTGAAEHYEQVIALAGTLGKKDIQSGAYFGKAQALRLLGKIQQTESNLKQGEDILRELSPRPLESSLYFYREQYYLCKIRGELDAALAAHEKYLTLYQEKLSADQRRAAAEMKARFDIERTRKEHAIARKDKEIFEQQSLQLQREVELKTKRITLTGLLLGQRNEILTKVKREALAKDRPVDSERLQRVVRLINEHLESVEAWESFNTEFELLHHDFISRVSRQFPLLTGTELKLCALIKARLSTEEIARLLCISRRSIETYRYRIRKKLGLNRQDDLTALLASL